jgi:drug/metabolite transporter (DMT)-like permease
VAGGLVCAGSAAFATLWLASVPAQIGISPLAVLFGGPLLPWLLGFQVGRANGRHCLGSWWGLAGIGLLSYGFMRGLPVVTQNADATIIGELTRVLVEAAGATEGPERLVPA